MWPGDLKWVDDIKAILDSTAPPSSGGSYSTGALVSDASTPLASHAAKIGVIVSNPSTATATLWASLTAGAAQGVGTEVPPGESRFFRVANSAMISVRASGTQSIGYTVI